MNPWLYIQSTGQLYRPDGSFCAVGYSGRAKGLDNPELQNVADVGPLPEGLYRLGIVDQEKGPFTIHLSPDQSNAMFGRSGFLVHGDNAEGNRTASEGCIVMPRLARIELARGGMLKVVERPEPQTISA